MLTLLKKLAQGQANLTAAEAALGTKLYLNHVTEQQDHALIDRLLAAVPEDQRPHAVFDAMYRFAYRLHEVTDRGTIRHFVDTIDALGAEPSLWKEFCDGGDFITSIVATEDVAVIDLILNRLARAGGAPLMADQLHYAAFDMMTVPMIDKLLALGGQWGGTDLVRKMIEGTNLALERTLDQAKPENSVDRLAAAKYLMQLQYEALGCDAVADSIGKLYDATEADWWAPRTEIATSVFRYLQELGGNALVAATLRRNDFYPVRALVYFRNWELLDVVEQLAVETHDQELIVKVRDVIETATVNPIDFGHVYDDIMQDCFKDESYSLQDWALERLTRLTGNADDFRLRFGKDIDAFLQTLTYEDRRKTTVQLLIRQGDREQSLEKLLDAHAHLGRWQVHDAVLDSLTGDMVGLPTIGVFERVMAYLQKTQGAAAAEAVLLGQVMDLDGETWLPQAWLMVLDGGRDEALRLCALAQQLGGQDLLDRFVTGHGRITLLEACNHRRQADVVEALLQLVSEPVRAAALQALPQWAQLLAGEAKPRQLFMHDATGNYRWRAITGADAPHPLLANFSPYKFRPQLYQSILPAITLAATAERKAEAAPIYAYKLATLFKTEEEVDKYLSRYIAEWGQDSQQPLHDACLFELPKHGQWKSNYWKDMMLRLGPAARPALLAAPRLEQTIGIENLPDDPVEMLTYLGAKSYTRWKEDLTLAQLAAMNGLDDENFGRLLDIHKKHLKTADFMPDVTIDGNAIGHPGFTMKRLAPDDARGYFLGLVSNSCQSVGNNGEPCALYGMSSSYSGFYLWTKAPDDPKDEEEIVAQSWAWIGPDDVLVFDSFERTEARYNHLARPFIEQFGHAVVDQHTWDDGAPHKIRGVALGCDPSGQTPPLPLPRVALPQAPRNYHGLYSDGTPARDSNLQYVIAPVDHRAQRVQSLPAVDGEALEAASRAGIAVVAAALQLQPTIAAELDFYAIDPFNRPVHLPDLRSIEAELRERGLQATLHLHGPSAHRPGHHYLTLPFQTPSRAAADIAAARVQLDEIVRDRKIGRVTFAPRPFRGMAWSGLRVTAAVPTTDFDAQAASQVISGVVLLCASEEIDYARLWNADDAPKAMGLSRVSDRRRAFWVNSTSTGQIYFENRLAGAGASPSGAVLATLIGVAHGLGGPPHVALAANPVSLPADRTQALDQLHATLAAGMIFEPAQEPMRAIAALYAPSARPA